MTCPEGSNHFVTFEGYCIPCPEYTIVSTNNMQCEMPKCAAGQKFMKDGTCETCPSGTRPIGDGTECATPKCEEGYEVQMDGSCKSVECEGNSYRSTDGECIQCDLYHIADQKDRKCRQGTCGVNQFVRPDG